MSILEGALTTLPLRVTHWLPVLAAEMTGWAAPGVELISLAVSGFELIGWAAGDIGPWLLLGLGWLSFVNWWINFRRETVGVSFRDLPYLRSITAQLLSTWCGLTTEDRETSASFIQHHNWCRGFELSLAVLEPGWVKQQCAAHGSTSVVPVYLAICWWHHHGFGNFGFSSVDCPVPVFRATALLGIYGNLL